MGSSGEQRAGPRWTDSNKRQTTVHKKRHQRTPEKNGWDADFTSTQRYRRLYRHHTAEGQFHPCGCPSPPQQSINERQPARWRSSTGTSGHDERASQRHAWTGDSSEWYPSACHPLPSESARFVLDNVLGAELVEDAAATLIALDGLPGAEGNQLLAGATPASVLSHDDEWAGSERRSWACSSRQPEKEEGEGRKKG